MTTLLMSPPPISISHRLIRCRYSNSRDVVASSPSFWQSAQESLLAGYFLRTLSAPITNGIVSVTVSIFHILALSVHIIRPPSLFLDRTDHEGASVLDSIFRWCQHPFLPAASETCIFFSLHDLTSSSTASYFYRSFQIYHYYGVLLSSSFSGDSQTCLSRNPAA